MKPTLIDTDILSLYFRGQKNVVSKFKEYVDVHDHINLSLLTYYEISSGLKYRDAKKQLQAFLQFAKSNVILPWLHFLES